MRADIHQAKDVLHVQVSAPLKYHPRSRCDRNRIPIADARFQAHMNNFHMTSIAFDASGIKNSECSPPPWSSTLSLHPNSRGEAPIHRGMEHNFFRRRSHPAAASTRLFGSILPVGSKSPSAARRLILFHSKGFGGSCDLFDQRARFYCWVLYLRHFFFLAVVRKFKLRYICMCLFMYMSKYTFLTCISIFCACKFVSIYI